MRTILLILIACIMVFSTNSYAASKIKSVKDGNALYNEGNYEGSIEKYSEALEKDPNSDIINFNAGTALYKNGDYADAVNNLKKSLLTEDENLKAKAHYNLGNVLYKNGISKGEANIDIAVQSLEQALGEYEKALMIDQDDEDAKYNYEFVKKVLEQLKKKQEQESKTCENKDNKESQEQDKKDRSSSQENKQEQQGEQGSKEEKEKEEQEGKGSEEKKEEEESGESRSQGEGEDKEGEEQDKSASMKDSKEMNEEEAERLLNNYQHAEEPKGMLQFQKRFGREHQVLKDW